MKMRDRFVVLTAGCAAAAMIAGGCEDSAAKRRAEVQAQVAEAGQTLYEASAAPAQPGDASFEATRQKLTAVIGKVGNLSGGEEGQQAAGALLAAAAHRKLAAMSLAQAAEVEAGHRRVRFLLNSGIDAAMRLEAMAAGRESVSSDVERAMLDEGRETARAELADYSQRMAELDGPISERESQNEQDAAEAARLNERARVLRREASELGHADGLSRFEEAVLLERQADRFELEIAQRDTDLRHELEPERNLAASQVEHLQTLLGQIDATQHDLDVRQERNDQEVSATRADIDAFRQRVEDSLDLISGEAAAALEALYSQAAGDLGQAVSKAQQASGRGSGGDAGRLVAARANELKGQLFWSQARGLAGHVAVLQRLIAADGGLGPVQRYQTELETAMNRHDQAMEQAETAFQAAKQQLMQVSGSAGRTEVEAFKRNLDASLALMTGEAEPESEPAPVPETPEPADETPAEEAPEAPEG